MSQQFRIPLEKPELADRKTRFAELNAWVTERGGWLTSVPGEIEVTMECLPGSVIPAQLCAKGHDVVEIGEGERILACAIEQKFTNGIDGELELLTAGSTRPVAMTVTHAGIVKVERYSFSLP